MKFSIQLNTGDDAQVVTDLIRRGWEVSSIIKDGGDGNFTVFMEKPEPVNTNFTSDSTGLAT